MAAITAGWLLVYYIAGGIGSAIGGGTWRRNLDRVSLRQSLTCAHRLLTGIWTNLVPGKLDEYFTDSTLAASAYANPTDFIKTHLPGTPERFAIARAHDETQRLLVIVGMSVSATALLVSLLLPNIRLPDTQSIEDEAPEGVKDSTKMDKAGAPILDARAAQMQ
jgi:SIT family siderophore-iron:H+ symporter-like MFS transporter